MKNSMINLLPVEEKRKIQSAYRWRVFAVALALLSFVSLVGTIALLPAYFSVASKYDIAAEAAKTGADFAEKEKGLMSAVEDANTKTAVLVKKELSVSPRDIFSILIAEKIAGIKLSSFSYEAETNMLKNNAGEKIHRVTVRGISFGRQDLLDYTDRLNANKIFSAVDLPISSFVKEKNLDFTMNTIITPPI